VVVVALLLEEGESPMLVEVQTARRKAKAAGYGYSGGAVTNSFDPATVAPGQKWNDVTVTVARYANPLRNEQECSSPVAFREGRFENYCTFVPDFTSGVSEVSYRIFVSNRSSSPVDICIVTNCNMSSSNKLCSIEQAPLQ